MYLLIVTGLSGAGKTQALRRIEDAGYFCVDNLPCQMLQGFVQLCEKAAPPVENAAVVIDSRESVFRYDVESAVKSLASLGARYEIIFLECRDEVLERRYNETRRRHPMADNIREGIRIERELLSPFRYHASHIIDTSDMKPLELTRELENILRGSFNCDFLITFESFGYKRGVPFEADFVFDMRFSPNPFYEPELRHLSGKDEAVRAYVSGDPDFLFTIDSVEAMLNRLIPRFIEQGKRRLLVAFGCTGGRHRSVCAAEEMYKHFAGKYCAKLIHRDTSTEAADIKERIGETGERS
ncbi:MAG: RNase adapter RapZ [Eubacteriales bacterium]|nr:RNase adapter RapZ [Eubacteriales bacterium]